MKKVLLLFILYYSQLYSQSNILINLGVDQSNKDIKQVIELWKNYLASNPDSLYDNPFWCNEEKLIFKRFDILSKVFFTPSVYSLGYKPLVLSIKPLRDYYEIKTAFYQYGKKSEQIAILAITNVYAKKDSGEYKLYNALPINRNKLNKKKFGSITYYYSSNHTFSTENAVRMENFIVEFTKQYKFPIKPIDFYIGEDFDEVMRFVGFDTYLSMGKTNPRGFSDKNNNFVLSGGNGEFYPHEVIHMYINPVYGDLSHYIFLEGFATLLGGHLGHPLEWHVKRLNQYLIEHPEIDLNNLLDFYEMDSFTNPAYVIGALFCERALKDGGYEKMQRLFLSGQTDEQFYNAIEKEFNVKKKELNTFIRNQINIWANNN